MIPYELPTAAPSVGTISCVYLEEFDGILAVVQVSIVNRKLNFINIKLLKLEWLL